MAHKISLSFQTGKTVDCAAALGAVISYSKPFVLGVVTDEDEGGQVGVVRI